MSTVSIIYWVWSWSWEGLDENWDSEQSLGPILPWRGKAKDKERSTVSLHFLVIYMGLTVENRTVISWLVIDRARCELHHVSIVNENAFFLQVKPFCVKGKGYVLIISSYYCLGISGPEPQIIDWSTSSNVSIQMRHQAYMSSCSFESYGGGNISRIPTNGFCDVDCGPEIGASNTKSGTAWRVSSKNDLSVCSTPKEISSTISPCREKKFNLMARPSSIRSENPYEVKNKETWRFNVRCSCEMQHQLSASTNHFQAPNGKDRVVATLKRKFPSLF